MNKLFMNFNNNSRIIYVTGPSGVGKDTLIGSYFEKYPQIVDKIVAHTTREKRNGELEGKDYYFVTKKVFNNYKEKMLDILDYNGNLYGLHSNELQKLGTKKLFFGQANFEGVFNIIERIGNIDENLLQKVVVFALHAEKNVIEERLNKRGTESKDDIKRRLEDVDRYNELYSSKFKEEVVNGPIKLFNTGKLNENGVFEVSSIALLKNIIINNQNNPNDLEAPIFDVLLKGIDSKYFNVLNSSYVKNFNL